MNLNLILIMLCVTLSTAYRRISFSPLIRTQAIQASYQISNGMNFGSKGFLSEKGKKQRMNKVRLGASSEQNNEERIMFNKKQNIKLGSLASSMQLNHKEDSGIDKSVLRFIDQDISLKTKKAIEKVLKLETMTEIQAKTLKPIISGKDMLARARTGTGKTVAFLVPALEHLTDTPGRVDILVISPTRELANQIAKQGQALLSFHDRPNIQVVYGGTNVAKDLSNFRLNKPSVLVATPGRLLDLMTTHQMFKDALKNLNVLVLDEADHLLDQGFEKELLKITQLLPQSRQTLLFSATVPPRLRNVMCASLHSEYETIDCVNDEESVSTSETNLQVPQEVVVIPKMERFVIGIMEVLRYSMAEAKAQGKQPKIIVFFSTANLTKFMAMLALSIGLQVIEIHSRLSQPKRLRASDDFRAAKKGILFTSNVSARGVDYPDVSHVIQIGIPDNRAQYIHRIGRTGRAGKGGKALLVLLPHERSFLREIEDFDIPTNSKLSSMFNTEPNESLFSKISISIGKIEKLNTFGGYLGPTDKRDGAELTKSAILAYQAWLGFYLQQTSRCSDKNKFDIVKRANLFASCIGFQNTPPPIEKKVLGKMGLKGVDGINVKI